MSIVKKQQENKEQIMKNIDQLDENFKIETDINENDLCFYSVKQKPFDLYGLYKPTVGEDFVRMPAVAAAAVSDVILKLCGQTSGGRVRFRTNSPYVAISAEYPSISHMPHMPLSGSTGFDMYTLENGQYKYVHSFIPPYDVGHKYESIFYFEKAEVRDIIINFPLYNSLSELYIGVREGCCLAEGGKYIGEKPIVYYGSSITQGACASRPGNCYQSIISRKLDRDYINLGFSGNARGEVAMAEYIARLDMSCFVYDYDYNAPDAEFLQRTHKRMFDIIRAENQDLPVIMMTNPSQEFTAEVMEQRRDIIFKTYSIAKQNGDENVYFIDTQRLFNCFGGNERTVDGVHPNDFGFVCMAEGLLDIMEKIF